MTQLLTWSSKFYFEKKKTFQFSFIYRSIEKTPNYQGGTRVDFTWKAVLKSLVFCFCLKWEVWREDRIHNMRGLKGGVQGASGRILLMFPVCSCILYCTFTLILYIRRPVQYFHDPRLQNQNHDYGDQNCWNLDYAIMRTTYPGFSILRILPRYFSREPEIRLGTIFEAA